MFQRHREPDFDPDGDHLGADTHANTNTNANTDANTDAGRNPNPGPNIDTDTDLAAPTASDPCLDRHRRDARAIWLVGTDTPGYRRADTRPWLQRAAESIERSDNPAFTIERN